MWYLAGNQSHANTAIKIMDSWSSTVKSVDPNCELWHDETMPIIEMIVDACLLCLLTDLDKQLASSLGPFMMTNAAEIIRYTSAGWSAAGIQNFVNMLTNVFYRCLNGVFRKPAQSQGESDWSAFPRPHGCTVPSKCRDRQHKSYDGLWGVHQQYYDVNAFFFFHGLLSHKYVLGLMKP
jgi:hypothetical protein